MTVREDATAKDIEALRVEMERLRGDLSAVTRTLRDLAGDAGSEAYEEVRARAARARVRAEEAAETMSATIGERPLVSVVGAFVLGLLMGLLFGRR